MDYSFDDCIITRMINVAVVREYSTGKICHRRYREPKSIIRLANAGRR